MLWVRLGITWQRPYIAGSQLPPWLWDLKYHPVYLFCTLHYPKYFSYTKKYWLPKKKKKKGSEEENQNSEKGDKSQPEFSNGNERTKALKFDKNREQKRKDD